MTTLAALADRAQNALADAGAGTWPQATVEEWCNEAFRDLSTYFPRTTSQTIDCEAGTHTYTLNTDVIAVVGVEYPSGQDPPEYLERLSHRHPVFWTRDGFYDVVLSGDPTADSTLYISNSPLATEDIVVTYTAPHDSSLLSAGTVTLPAHLEPLALLFVVWKAHAERLGEESQSPDVTTQLLDRYRRVVAEALVAYEAAVRQAEKRQAPGGWAGPWTADEHDPIY